MNEFNIDKALLDLALEIKNTLIDKKSMLSTAESITSGILQDTFANISGVSACFSGGVTAYNLDAKVNILGVDKIHAKEVNCVSPTVAMEMAKGSMTLFKSDIAISTTGYAEPYPEMSIKEPYAFISVSTPYLQSTRKIEGKNSPDKSRQGFRKFVSYEALKMISEIIK
jgi:nicotinamide-nucleotide amidase